MEKQTQKQLAMMRGEKIRTIRKEVLHLSRIQFAKKYKLSAGTIQNWEDARNGGLTEKGANIIIEIFKNEGINCNLEWLMYDLGNEPLQLKNTHCISRQISRVHNNNAEIKQISRELTLFFEHNQFAIDCWVVDDTMEPILHKGDLVAGKRFTGEDIKKLHGKVCIIQTQAGHLIIRTIKPGKMNNYYDLIATNQNSRVVDIDYYNIQIISAAPVQWIRRS